MLLEDRIVAACDVRDDISGGSLDTIIGRHDCSIAATEISTVT